jgi:hypothetical protein
LIKKTFNKQNIKICWINIISAAIFFIYFLNLKKMLRKAVTWLIQTNLNALFQWVKTKAVSAANAVPRKTIQK